MSDTAVTRSIRAGSTARSPRSARDTVLGLTPAARATSLKVTRPEARCFLVWARGLGKGLSVEVMGLKVYRIALSHRF
jgi:hypothetical protein